jgi:prepilin-type N-terminal cleavage/methylation domain-containing protein
MQDHGFTLIELLIGMAILGIAFTGLISMQISCLSGISNSCNLTTAVTLAQDKMETLKGLSCNHFDLTDTNPTNNSSLRQSVDSSTSDHREDRVVIQDTLTELGPDLDYGTYRRIWNVADNTPFSGSKTVMVIVTWESGNKRVILSSVL